MLSNFASPQTREHFFFFALHHVPLDDQKAIRHVKSCISFITPPHHFLPCGI
jgi:hypothetical protein